MNTIDEPKDESWIVCEFCLEFFLRVQDRAIGNRHICGNCIKDLVNIISEYQTATTTK